MTGLFLVISTGHIYNVSGGGDDVSVRIYVFGQQKDIERFFEEVIYPETSRLYEIRLFRISENKEVYTERNKTTHTVERLLRGYCPLSYKKPEEQEVLNKYVVEKGEPKILGKDIERVKETDIELKISMQGDHSEIKIFFEEVICRHKDIFDIEKDTGIYPKSRIKETRNDSGGI